MKILEVKNLVLKYPVYTNPKRSLKNKIINISFAGKINKDENTTYIQAIDGISFDVNYGDKIGIIGGNGSGKTTLLRSIMGIYEPISGSILCKEKITSLLILNLE